MYTLKTYWRTILVICIILFLSLMNVNKVLPSEVKFFKHFDKIVHFLMYFGLSFIFFIENYVNKNSIRKYWIIIDTILIGISIEFLQFLLTNYRSGNFYDAVFNSIGVLAGSILFILMKDQNFIYKVLLFKLDYKR
ncbi:VanZ family protein [Plebeiibacterium sediminum]|uniref:VanZ family protein n=1 Tax=Plebeiibacterium sediminum TaxID=2992112 RepID=UPI00341E2C97